MSYADINKWISGETDVFDPHHIPLPSGESNPQKESSPPRSSFWGFTYPAIAIVVLAIVTVLGLVLSTRYAVEPLAAAAKSAHSDSTTAPTSVSRINDPPPNLHQRTTTFSDARLTASLKKLDRPFSVAAGCFRSVAAATIGYWAGPPRTSII